MSTDVPLDTCATCNRPTRRLLSIEGGLASRRCDSCGNLSLAELPTLDKKVIYLDQLAISEVFKVKSGSMPSSAPHFEFWTSATRAIEQAALLQQAVFPASDIHRDETMVFSRGPDLALAHEMIAGDVTFRTSWDIERDQLWAYLQAFDDGADLPPSLDLRVDNILEGRRNEWLPRLHVSAAFDWSGFADIVRKNRERTSGDLAALFDNWRSRPGTSFQSVLELELENFGGARTEAYRHFCDMVARGVESGDTSVFMNGALSGPVEEVRRLREHFQLQGLSRDDADRRVLEFWNWPANHAIPHHRIAAYLFAAIARKLTTGQKRNPTRGVLNDMRAISVYAPYVDAMFVDSEFAAYLSEEPLRSELTYKASVFSLRSRDAFLAYLHEIVAKAPDDVEQCAVALYGQSARRSASH